MNLHQATILIVDDDKDILTAVRFLLKMEVKEILTETNPENIQKLITEKSIDLILLDMNFKSSVNTGNEGLFWLKEIKKWRSFLTVIMITAYADIDLAVKSLKEGAADFIVKPWHNEHLLNVLSETLQKQTPAGIKERITRKKPNVEIVGESECMRLLFHKLQKIAPTDANVLILGENGTGKDLVARSIYQSSLRRDDLFVKVDVGSLTETLFESELFGHKKGAFTDAREDRKGLIESADKGTLFLDEIGNINLQQQAKLLTVLQNREITRLGANTPTPVDIRLISATNLPLRELANEERFRKDLIYRINTVEITVPPLRERGSDILLLAKHFLEIYGKKYFKQKLSLSDSARKKLMLYHYPGNVRELQYTIERGVIMADSDVLRAEDITFSPIEQQTEAKQSIPTHNLEDLERTAIEQAVQKHNGNISQAAKELGLTRGALYRRLEKYGL
ncbi:two-component system response regulator HydG [Parabacteroides sp. PF5-5]|uniref:sigma-54-dependent transcriptional regulator n=1 Tax=unclassified Parabacteroides TaxID=2649774 RepID=UPI002476B12C|nr:MULTISPECIES: sigma-54 dependent transcriptional regulator [unclassified Parabacteroides]MDH6303502.1 two-component system response regulator HydG [Parabacteroides sp. PH5-39]MDH6314824.1 two-component system response regulator HydG [Parabacteroides sp. PF5-13]MDH6318161.1 two-component system response regulator HydG [Parabacteroides sp. PH5-13]MDH6321907.1 two-component system response regulator HydG [Parabacteroides sp. PH5-8]MDH6326031.1 two-component system response regulator HydG [Para